MDHLFSTEIGERRLHSNSVGTPNIWFESGENFKSFPCKASS